jgi:hypothetical protein
MTRRLTLAACALAVLAAPTPAAAAKRPRCNLTGTNLAHSRTVKVVRRTSDETQTVTLLGCLKPNGRVWKLAEGVMAETTTTSLSLDGAAGTWVAIRSHESSQYGDRTSLKTADVRSGKSYAVASESYNTGGPYQGQLSSAVAVNSRGFTAAMLDDVAGSGFAPTVDKRHVVVFDSRGTLRELDSGAPSDFDPQSLILDTHTVLWSHGGLTRYSRF